MNVADFNGRQQCCRQQYDKTGRQLQRHSALEWRLLADLAMMCASTVQAIWPQCGYGQDCRAGRREENLLS